MRPEVLAANKDVIRSLKGLPSIDESVNLADPSFEFPPWPYITDVNVKTKRKSVISSPAAPVVSQEAAKNPLHERVANSMETPLVTKKRPTLADFFATPLPSKRPKTELRENE